MTPQEEKDHKESVAMFLRNQSRQEKKVSLNTGELPILEIYREPSSFFRSVAVLVVCQFIVGIAAGAVLVWVAWHFLSKFW